MVSNLTWARPARDIWPCAFHIARFARPIGHRLRGILFQREHGLGPLSYIVDGYCLPRVFRRLYILRPGLWKAWHCTRLNIGTASLWMMVLVGHTRNTTFEWYCRRRALEGWLEERVRSREPDMVGDWSWGVDGALSDLNFSPGLSDIKVSYEYHRCHHTCSHWTWTTFEWQSRHSHFILS